MGSLCQLKEWKIVESRPFLSFLRPSNNKWVCGSIKLSDLGQAPPRREHISVQMDRLRGINQKQEPVHKK